MLIKIKHLESAAILDNPRAYIQRLHYTNNNYVREVEDLHRALRAMRERQ